MKKRFGFSAMAVAVALVFSFTACGDDSSSGSSSDTVSSKEDMEKESCTEDNQGDVIHVEDEDADYTCNGEEWEKADEVSSSSAAVAKSSAAKECDEDVEDCDDGDEEECDEDVEDCDDGDDEVSSSSDEEETSSESKEEESSSSKKSSKSSSSEVSGKSSSSEAAVVVESSSSEESGKSSSSEAAVVVESSSSEVSGKSSSSEATVVVESSSSEVSGKSSSSEATIVVAGYKIVVMAGSSSSQRTMIYKGETMLFKVPGLAACNYEVDDDTYLSGDNIGDTGYDDDCPMNLQNEYDGTESVALTFSVTSADRIIVPDEEYETLPNDELPASVEVTLCGTTNCRPSAFNFLDELVKWTSSTEATTRPVSESQSETVAKALQAALEKEGYKQSSTDPTLFIKTVTHFTTQVKIGRPVSRSGKVVIPLTCTAKLNNIKL